MKIKLLFVLLLLIFSACQKEPEKSNVDTVLDDLRAKAEALNLEAIKAQKVRVSMSKTEVIRSIGSPDKTERVTDPVMRERAEETWHYGNYENFVMFGYDGKVVACSDGVNFSNK